MKALAVVLTMMGFFSLIGCQPKVEPERNAVESAEFFKDINTLPAQEAQETHDQAQDEMQASGETSPSDSEDPLAMLAASDKPSIQDIQSALKNANLYQGKIDGLMGPKTRKAVEDFQEQNGLKVDGRVGPQTWGKLRTYFNAPAQDASLSQDMASSQQTETSAQSSGMGD